MTWVDAVCIGVLVVSGLLAFARGFVREVLGIAAWVGAAVLAVWATPYLRPRFEAWMHDRPALGEP
ncbi:MAG: CvpA family protein, partial [Acetobacteraceae bacterium]|nr:CvpA family protein [Acetobacteraceae bacterium]